MVHSHHTHSGQYVAHAIDSLDDMVALAHLKGFTTFCLTEHMPRLVYLYPEEIDRDYTIDSLFATFEEYLVHATRLKEQYRGKMQVLVGFEVEGTNTDHLALANKIRQNPSVDMCVGSVHFVEEIPIDFDRELWEEACRKCGGVRQLYLRYFETQHAMLKAVKPEVVGHFDLIRLYTKEGEAPTDLKQWPEVWQQIQTNIDLINLQGGLIELNSSAIRKGWLTPYPQNDVAEEVKRREGRFCLSDDCHSLKQVGLNYGPVIDYAKAIGIEYLYELGPNREASPVALTDVKNLHSSNIHLEDAYMRFGSHSN
ncbi:hypothetical protein DIURU_002846 [Diutina rugosa]|uniref:Histidinol-phosphatase n=1 Tax=Diutina rugosa TaxID=5481 RepID=A0A642UNF4_DIURU|nr:uncharacterized protein DIURU_002846 [Diutina rugosa]KAA8902392.1 hypothetical protein DIURU_002846 [Diutina rugosa]